MLTKKEYIKDVSVRYYFDVQFGNQKGDYKYMNIDELREELREELRGINLGIICNRLNYYYVHCGQYIKTDRVNSDIINENDIDDYVSRIESEHMCNRDNWKDIDELIYSAPDIEALESIKILMSI